MKKKLIDYYAVIMMILFIVYNLVLENLKIVGLLYKVFMFLLIIINAIILVVFRKKIKYKSIVIIIYFFTMMISKNSLQFFFDLSNIIILCITGFIESHLIKVISLLITIFLFIFSLPLFFAVLLAFSIGFDDESGRDDIYDDMHYYCDNNYEVYSYSAGAMDSFHYSIGKYYNVLNIDGIINISYSERNEKSQVEYEEYLKNHNCKLVGDRD